MINPRLTLYTLHANGDEAAFATTDAANLGRVVTAMCGRNALSYPSVAAKLRNSGSVYLAGARGQRGVVVRSACGFCKGQPVADAASWADGQPRDPAPCPRCARKYRA
jgi:hypothetical protein